MNNHLKLKILKILFLGVLFFSYSGLVFCESTDDLRKEIEFLKQRIAKLEERLEQQEEKLAEQEEVVESSEGMKEFFNGISVGADATFIVQATDNANGVNLSQPGEDVVDGSYSVDLWFEKEFDDYAMAYIELSAGGGAGVDNDLQLFSGVNFDADDDQNVVLSKAWYEHYFNILGSLTVTFGKISSSSYFDINEYANDETFQFLAWMFGNSPVIEFPSKGFGLRTAIEPAEFLDIELLAMDGDGDWGDVFDGMFFGAQFNFKPKFFNRGGNYRFLAWLNDQEHTKWMDNSITKEQSYGFGISFDQELTDNLGIFARYGWQNPKVYLNGEDFSLEQSWSAGFQLDGNLWGRKGDIFGIAFGQIFPSSDYKSVLSLRAKSEDHFEAYYKIRVNEHLELSPDLQVIWDPYGGDAINGSKTIIVGGMRTQVWF